MTLKITEARKVIGLFAKYWQPGRVKTRLGQSIGNEASCQVYVEFLTHLVKRFATTAEERVILFSPDDKEAEFKQFCLNVLSKDTWHRMPQVNADLGTRMQTFFQEQFAPAEAPARDQKVLVIGADSPQLTIEMVEQAYQVLNDHDVVIGPSTDGGYYLLGMRDQCFNIFEGIQWSTESVLENTIAKLNQLGASYDTLQPLTDVDQFDDVATLELFLQSRKQDKSFDELDQQLLSYVSQLLIDTADDEGNKDDAAAGLSS